MHFDTVIVGGGISGLSTAFYLQKYAAARSISHTYAIFDSSDRWGGKLKSSNICGPDGENFIIEDGPDSLSLQKPCAMELLKELGFEDRIIDSDQHNKAIWISLKKRLLALPEGVMLMVPTKFIPFIASSLISVRGKLRVAFEYFISKRKVNADESLAAFVRRRMGKEVLEKIAEPLLAGIFSADPEKQSVASTFPHFVEMESKYGSLLSGFIRSRFKVKSPNTSAHSMFVSLKSGMQELSNKLVAALKGKCSLEKAVTAINQLDDGLFCLKISDGTEVTARSVVLTLPAYATARLISSFAVKAASQLNSIRYVSTGSIYFAYKASPVVKIPKGFGVLVPKGEKRSINSISFSSQKFPGRAPKNYILIRVSFGGSRNPQIMLLDNESIERQIRLDLSEILGISEVPLFSHMHRWIDAMPQYDVGHKEKIQRIETSLPSGLFLAGSAFHGVSIPDCIMQGRAVAEAALSK